MELIIVAILAILIGLSFGIVGGLLGRKIISKNKLSSAELEALQIVESAKEEEKALIIKAKEQALKVQSERDSEYRERRSEISQVERRLSNREDNLERRSSNIERRERTLSDKNKEADQLRTELETIKDQELEKLEEIASLSIVDARSNLMEQAQQDIEHELEVYFREEEEKAKEEANSKARTIVSEAIQRLASDVVSEASLTSVPLPSDDMKGRIIGREGRNIRAIEKSTGVDIIIDDNPEAVTLSCFDPIRREIARMSMTKLIADGRIHPARIEEIVQKSGKELDEIIRKSGESAVIEVGIRGLNAELTRLLGRLKYRFCYGENVLLHSMEVAHLAGMMASEIGADIKVSKMGGLLHDIGKALTHEIEGPHAEIGADVAARNKVPKHICSTIAEHHDDDHSSPESFIVAAADAISAARPGSRRDTVEHYIKRLEALEEVGHGFDGVEKCFAIQAGREIRIMVTPESIDDIAANKMAREVSKKIEETLTYPGQIKVTVIRESRSVEYAR